MNNVLKLMHNKVEIERPNIEVYTLTTDVSIVIFLYEALTKQHSLYLQCCYIGSCISAPKSKLFCRQTVSNTGHVWQRLSPQPLTNK